MATKTKRRKRKAVSQEPQETADQRLAKAVTWAGMTRSQVAFHLRISPSRIETWWPSIGVSRDMHLAVSLAQVLHVDPRWLLLGLPSPAGAAAADHFGRLGEEPLDPLDPFQRWREGVQAFLRTTPEPDRGAGICRYCGCEDDRGCAHGSGGSCWWVDGAATICSACLEPGDED
jgi:hypothetical protein